jgi:hypothetical protein
MQYALTAISLADNQRQGDAKKLLERCDKMIINIKKIKEMHL